LTSIHGPDAQTHAQNVGVAEAFEQTCAGVRHFVRWAQPGVELGAKGATLHFADKLIRSGKGDEEIAELTELPIEAIQALRKE